MSESPVVAVLVGRTRDLGDFTVRRVLPAIERRAVGPFLFLDHMGPVSGHGIDVRPHPHIGLATVTYLFAGEIEHRDNLGSRQTIRAGDINWMTAGRGIVHSERHPAGAPATTTMHGLQIWVGLPTTEEEREPSFHHHPAHTLPEVDRDGAHLRVLAGTAYGLTSPVRTFSPLFYVDADLPEGCALSLPHEHAERAAYVVEGEIVTGDQHAGPGTMLVFAEGAAVTVQATVRSRIAVLGGAPLDGTRHLFWNFVSSSRERIDRAADDWRAHRFPVVPGDEVEFIPLP